MLGVRRDELFRRRSVPAAEQLRRRTRSRARRRGRTRGDTGAVSAELAVATPLLLLMLLFVVQAAVWMHATHIAQAAATRAATTAAAYQSSAASGESTGRDTLHAIGNGVLQSPTVSVRRTAADVHVEVAGTAETVVPGIRWHVRAVVVRPVERFVPDGQG